MAKFSSLSDLVKEVRASHGVSSASNPTSNDIDLRANSDRPNACAQANAMLL